MKMTKLLYIIIILYSQNHLYSVIAVLLEGKCCNRLHILRSVPADEMHSKGAWSHHILYWCNLRTAQREVMSFWNADINLRYETTPLIITSHSLELSTCQIIGVRFTNTILLIHVAQNAQVLL